jgi:hypothetical protein
LIRWDELLALTGSRGRRISLPNDGSTSIGHIFLIANIFACAISVFANEGRAENEFVQSQAHFERAIRNRSTETYVIFATIVNDNTGEAHTECVAAPFLLGAIHREYDLIYDEPSIDRAVQIALANPSHVFHFSKEVAIKNIPSFTKDAEVFRRRFQEACALVRQGRSVFLGDRGGQIRIVP